MRIEEEKDIRNGDWLFPPVGAVEVSAFFLLFLQRLRLVPQIWRNGEQRIIINVNINILNINVLNINVLNINVNINKKNKKNSL